MTKRITVDEVRAAYEALGLQPIRGLFTWTEVENGQRVIRGCCALSALAKHRTGNFISQHVFELEQLGYDHSYLMGFLYGWDGTNPPLEGACPLGLEDGEAAARILRPIDPPTFLEDDCFEWEDVP
jgi:hypothetical protein